MAVNERYGFFNAKQDSSGKYDRTYNAEDFTTLFSLFMTNGVFSNPTNQLQVTVGSGTNVTVNTGHAFIKGYWYKLKNNATLSVANTGSSNTTFAIVVSLDTSNRTIHLKAINQNKVIPSNTKVAIMNALVLALVNVKSGASSISNSDIRDTRPDKSMCGFVTGTIDQIDTTDLFNQFQSSFDEWFNSIKNKLTTDQAGSLQTQINKIGSSSYGSYSTMKKWVNQWGKYPSDSKYTLNFDKLSGIVSGVYTLIITMWVETPDSQSKDFLLCFYEKQKRDDKTGYNVVNTMSEVFTSKNGTMKTLTLTIPIKKGVGTIFEITIEGTGAIDSNMTYSGSLDLMKISESI